MNRIAPLCIAFIFLLLSWAGAFLLASSDWRPLALLFFTAKRIMLTSTILATLCNPSLALRLFLGRYQFDHDHRGHGIAQAILRFWWELPQFGLGYLFAQWRLIFGHISHVVSIHGISYAIEDNRNDKRLMGISLGGVVNIWLSSRFPQNWETNPQVRDLLSHEFGHTIDSLRWGWLYLFVVGIPSLISVFVEKKGWTCHRHQNLYAERWANANAAKYFKKLLLSAKIQVRQNN